ncbi:hypothetical protein LFL96_04860 [Paraburkholderia sp. D15]|uniref:hypothetical protein n=1 Tax=Paraburkholderia sp. D15 TaxID=2880218 RepID=UPI00247AD649|nr:hypothetical protein [Paraburkholderia sp. D15]WGS50839.1 hypothetical protein LFL96_04860 [Paraburkholderia sp. D15]
MTLDERLNNWAKAMRGGTGHSDTLVASIYFPNVGGRTVSTALNAEDAQKVERAWQRLMPLDRKVLQMHFVWSASPAFICRRLGLKVRPTSIFDLALTHAKRAIGEKLLEMGREPQREYVSMQAIIDRLNAERAAQCDGECDDCSDQSRMQPLAETR